MKNTECSSYDDEFKVLITKENENFVDWPRELMLSYFLNTSKHDPLWLVTQLCLLAVLAQLNNCDHSPSFDYSQKSRAK